MTHDERLRPDLHFTTPGQWMNDPNGLVFFRDEYHLFFQTNPTGSNWGNISWGHATSRDLIAWELHEHALSPYPARVPDATTLIFSGSVVADRDRNGRLTGRLRAYYTAHERRGETPLNESVGLAWSDDAGRSWSYEQRNPVLDRHRTDFRDPKVFWFAADKLWVMVISEPKLQSIEIYRSVDGIEWEPSSVFHLGGSEEQLWECPDLFQLAVADADETRWFLVVSGVHRAGAPYTGMQYWVGDFDGSVFTAESDVPRPFEYGKDCFAGITYNELGTGSDPVMIAWASNWAYASATPTPGWRGMMTIPRRLWLERVDGESVLCQAPMPVLDGISHPAEPGSRHAAAVIDVDVGPGHGIVVFESADRETVAIHIEPADRRIAVDRRNSGEVDFHPSFASRDEAPLPEDVSAGVDVRILVDHSIVEVFAAGGRVAMTSLVFPSGPWAISFVGDVRTAVVASLQIGTTRDVPDARTHAEDRSAP